MKRKLKKFILPLAVLSMILSGCNKTEETAEEVNLTPVEVQEMNNASIKKELVYAGQVKPNETVNVTSKLSGLVESVKYDVGDFVKQGDVLFTLDKKDIQDQIKQLEASLKVSDTSVESAKTGLNQVSNGGQVASSRLSLQSGVENAGTAVENAKKSLENAQNAVDNAQKVVDNAEKAMENAQKSVDNAEKSVNGASIQLDNAKISLDDIQKKYEDNKKLYDAGVISRSDFESIELARSQAQNAYNQAQNAYDQATITYEQSKTSYEQSQTSYEQTQIAYKQSQTAYEQSQIAYNQAVESYGDAKESLSIFENKTTSDNIASAQDGLNTAVASRDSVSTQLEIAKSTLNDTSVKAPISGYISAKNISETNMVSAQSAPYTIVDMSKVTVEVNVSEKIINLIKVGEKVDVVIPTIGDKIISGVIKTISPSSDTTKTYPVVIEIENSASSIKSGMFAEIHFVESEAKKAFVVPRNTVLENDKDKYVYVVEDGKAVKKVVSLGIDNGENIQILEGVGKGDKVVVNGQDYIIDGEEVRIIENTTAEKESESTTEGSASKKSNKDEKSSETTSKKSNKNEKSSETASEKSNNESKKV